MKFDKWDLLLYGASTVNLLVYSRLKKHQRVNPLALLASGLFMTGTWLLVSTKRDEAEKLAVDKEVPLADT